ncbi:MAG: hypothetical protein JWM77_2823 [Rhodospirillales bacterium]|jgi:hypothetical protein|nr:hypothetical protein [Rhodospirillales bacterium]
MQYASIVIAVAVVAAATSPAPAADKDLFARPALHADELARLTGGEVPNQGTITSQTVTAISSGNSITGAAIGSGDIALTQGALSGFSGIGNWVINTGHNNTLQGTLSVSVVSGR